MTGLRRFVKVALGRVCNGGRLSHDAMQVGVVPHDRVGGDSIYEVLGGALQQPCRVLHLFMPARKPAGRSAWGERDDLG